MTDARTSALRLSRSLTAEEIKHLQKCPDALSFCRSNEQLPPMIILAPRLDPVRYAQELMSLNWEGLACHVTYNGREFDQEESDWSRPKRSGRPNKTEA